MKRNFFLFLLIAIGISACNQSGNQNTDDATNGATTTNDKPDPNLASYKHLKGVVNGIPVTMNLHKYLNGPGMGGNPPFTFFTGYYNYDSRNEPIEIMGQLDSIGNIVLEEELNGETTGTWAGKFESENTFNGFWKDAAGKKSYPFELTESYTDGALSFDSYLFADSMLLDPKSHGGPAAYISSVVIWPAASMDAATASFLKEALVKGILSDSIHGIFNTPSEIFTASKTDFFKNYKEQMKEVDLRDTLLREDPAAYTYEQSGNVFVLWNDSKYLSLGYTTYLYNGGAHGNYGTAAVTYDLRNKKALTLKDIFKPGYETKLSAALTTAARNKFRLKPGQKLSEVLFEDKIAPNDNFFLTAQGIVFNFAPYEVAAYALGEIKIYIPFSELRDQLNAGF